VSVMTVLGPVAPRELGLTLMHEHLLITTYRVTGNEDAFLDDEDQAVAELAAFMAAGGRTLVDMTNRGLGRNPEGLRRIARATGAHIVMGCGWYRQNFYDETIVRTRTDDLAADMVRDLTVGADGTDVRAGVIGEIGVEKHYVSASEERVLRAAARAHKQTGAAVSTHAVYAPIGLEQLDILVEDGVDPRRVIIGHCDTYLRLDYHEAILRRGAYVQYDTFGKKSLYPDDRRVACLVELLRRGHASQIMLSSDVCRRSELHAYGGHGYDHVPTNILPALRKQGVSDEQIHTMTVDNPARVLNIS
jgi:predicted metal-dependent phosphotriesterase family hydrolase